MVVQAEAELSMRKYQNGFTLITNVQVKPQKLKCQAVQVILFTGYWYGAEQIIDEYGNIKATSSRFTDNVTVYAGWSAKVFKITLDNQGADKRTAHQQSMNDMLTDFSLKRKCKQDRCNNNTSDDRIFILWILH